MKRRRPMTSPKPMLRIGPALGIIKTRAVLAALMMMWTAPIGLTQESEQPLTYIELRRLAAEEFLELAKGSWDVGDPGAAMVFAKQAYEIRLVLYGPSDAEAQQINEMAGDAVRMIESDASHPERRVVLMSYEELEALHAEGNLEAAHELGIRNSYAMGGDDADAQRAIEYLFEPARQGRADSMFELGRIMRDNRIRRQLIAHWMTQGPEASIGHIQLEADPKEFQVFNDAHVAGNENAGAFVAIGLIGQAAAVDASAEEKERGEEGWDLLNEIARKGNVWGEYLLAKAFALGFGITANHGIARSWAEKASIQGLPEAQTLFAELVLADSGIPPADASTHRKAWVQLYCAASQDDWLAYYPLGIRLARGDGIERMPGAGKQWLAKAAAAGHMLAASALRQLP